MADIRRAAHFYEITFPGNSGSLTRDQVLRAVARLKADGNIWITQRYRLV